MSSDPFDIQNIFQAIPAALPEEHFQTLVNSEHVRIERIVSKGHHAPESGWFDQPQQEWVVLLRGEAMLQFENGDRRLHLRPGDSLCIPAHARHRVTWTTPDEPSIWLAIHYPAPSNQDPASGTTEP